MSPPVRLVSCRMFLLSTRLVVSLLLLSKIGLALRNDTSGRYDILQGTRGESACTLKDDIIQKCTMSSNRGDFSFSPTHDLGDDAPLVPSTCTCNAIFFNIWSACDYSTGNNTLPDYTQWMDTCTMSTIDIDSSIEYSEVRGNLGIDVPSWASMTVPGNSTFDIQRAVTIASSGSHRWTTLQIVLPVVVAFLTLLISGLVLLAYQRSLPKLSRGSNRICLTELPKGMKSLRYHTSQKFVTTIDRDEAWEIDGPNSAANHPSFVNFAPSSNDCHGHWVPVRSPSYDMRMKEFHTHDKKSKTVTSLKSPTEKSPIRSLLPWKRSPPHVTLVRATSRFRVDDSKSIFTVSNEAGGRNEVNVPMMARELTEEDHVPPEIDETRSLITPSELAADQDFQEVILISKDGRSFTLDSNSQRTGSINSHIRVISPSVSSTSPQSAMYPVSAMKFNLYPPPIPPPPPSHAAPASPIIPQSLRPMERPRERKNSREQSLPFFQSPFLAPIKEANSPGPSPLSSTTDVNVVNIHRSPAVRRSSNPESFSSSQYIPPSDPPGPSHSAVQVTTTATTTAIPLAPPSSNFNLPGPDLSRAFEMEDGEDFYMANAAASNTNLNGLYLGHPKAADSDASCASFYYNPPGPGPPPPPPPVLQMMIPPVQPPVQPPPMQRQPASAKLEPLRSPTSASAFYAAPVRGAQAGYYSFGTDTTRY